VITTVGAAAVVLNVDAIRGPLVRPSAHFDVGGHVDTVHFQVAGEAGHIALPGMFASPWVAGFAARSPDGEQSTPTSTKRRSPGP
jgi:hypothetical protein